MNELSKEESDFQWDKAKAQRNLAVHGITFEEAMGLFFDPEGLRRYDSKHSVVEDRFLLLAKSPETERILLTWYTRRGRSIRLIGVRKASRPDRKEYEQADRDIL